MSKEVCGLVLTVRMARAGAGRGRCCGPARISNRYVREFVAECLGTKKGLGNLEGSI